MFTGPVGPVEVFFHWPKAVLVNFYWPGASGSLLALSPAIYKTSDHHKRIKEDSYQNVVI